MSIKTALIILFLPVIAVAGSIENIQHMELPITGVRSLQIKSGAGNLDVFGVAASDTIKVMAAIMIDDLTSEGLQDFLDRHVLLSLEKKHRKAILRSEFIHQKLMEADARIDLTVEVPRNLQVSIDDGTGSIFITGLVTDLEIIDGSGSIEIRMTTGNITISDGSGEIELTDINGDVEVKDGSGPIHMNRVKGDVRVVDGSGSINLEGIEGNLMITDGSGSIELNEVSQNVFIKEAGSGTLEIDGARGKVTVRE